VNRLAFSQGHELAPHGATAVAITPGWLRSRGLRVVRVAPIRRARGCRVGNRPGQPEPAVGTSGQLATEYGFTDVDGSQPDVWRFIEEIREPGLYANPDDYR